jgi:aspartate aminotransferase
MLYEIAEKVIKLQNQGRKIIKFNVGDPDQATNEEIVDTAFKAMKAGKTKYGSSSGERMLREKLAEIYNVKAENVTIMPGSKWAVFSSLFIMLKKGDNIVLPSPHWNAYSLMAQQMGMETRLLKCELKSDWEIDVDKMNDLIDERTRMIILNNPNNPTSKVVNGKTVEKIVELSREKCLPILSDESYSDISFLKVKSILGFPGDHIFVNSFSKTFAMTGWRIGFTISNNEFAEKLTRLNQITMTCVPQFIQEAAIKALELRDKIAGEVKEVYRKRVELAYDILSKSKLEFSKADSPFYLFPRCDGDSEKLALSMLDDGVAVTPGTAFGDYREHFRIALTVPDVEVEEGLKKIAKVFS